jgi:hypothetical protein
MSDLERQLTRLGQELDWPATPSMAGPVAARVQAGARPRGVLRPAGFRRSLAIALAGLLLLAGGVAAAVPSVRDSVLEFFGLQGATVERREELPPVPDRRPLRLGERTTIAAAADSAGFGPLVPRSAGRPNAVYIDARNAVSLAYRPGPGMPESRGTGLGLLVTEFRGDVAPEYVRKFAGEATVIDQFRVGGERAIWMEGALHVFVYRDADGSFVNETLRVAGNVLLLERGPLLIRFEGAFGRARALELARSLR